MTLFGTRIVIKKKTTTGNNSNKQSTYQSTK